LATPSRTPAAPGAASFRESLAGCFLTLVRRTRALAPRLAHGPERDGLLLLLAQGEVAAMAAGAFAGLPRGEGSQAPPLDAAELIRRALQRVAPTLKSLTVGACVRSVVAALPIAAPWDGFVRGLSIAIGCAAVAAGRGGAVGIDVAVEGEKLTLAVEGREGPEASSPSPLPFSPAEAVAALLACGGGSLRVGGGVPPRAWRLDVPLASEASPESLVASAP
jgi:hypothetical protein